MEASRFRFVMGCLLLLLLANLLTSIGFRNDISLEGFADRVLYGGTGCQSGDCLL